MPRQVTILQVLVSSPADLTEERELLRDIVAELNQTWRDTSGLQLNLLMWESDTRPSLGPDAQSVINEQLGDDYDIFLGIMGARFGTATPRAGSGTQEEFERARARFEKNQKSVSVMFYFKDTPIPPSKIDPDQLQHVQTFRQTLEAMGLIKIFKSRDEFARLIRIHLTQEAQVWAKRIPVSEHALQATPAPAEDSQIETAGARDEDEGYIDLIERGEEEFQLLGQTIDRISTAVSEVGAKTNERVAELNEVNAAATGTGKPADLKAIKRIANHTAEHLNDFVTRLEAEIPIYASGFKRALDPFMRAVSMPEIRHDKSQELTPAISSIGKLISTQEAAISSYRGMRDTIAGVPRITTAFNHAKRRAVDSVSHLLEEFEKSLRLTREMESLLRNVAARRD
jgi:Domain of unknown function (DUF4062)